MSFKLLLPLIVVMAEAKKPGGKPQVHLEIPNENQLNEESNLDAMKNLKAEDRQK